MAVNEKDEANRGVNSFAPGVGKVRSEIIDAATTCNSLWELAGAETGAAGADRCLGAAQHAILQHFPPVQQDLAAGAVGAGIIAATG